MSGSSLLGMTGLTTNVNKRESARADMETLGKLVQMKEADEAKEQQAALMEQQYYERLRTEADKLLSGDRTAINEKAKQIQAEVRHNIRLFGGSRQKFMANGGMSMLGNYSDQILNSKELGTYRQNKENLTRILDIKEKGMGHLLTLNDQRALEEYERTGRGTITYSGLMNEVEIPKSELFDYGYEMTPMDIYKTGSNKVKIAANWMLENPGQGTPDQKTLLAYIQAKGWSGRGSNLQAMQMRASAQEKQTKKEDSVHTFATSLAAALAPQNVVDIDKIGGENAFTFDPFLTNLIGKRKWNKRGNVDPSFGNMLGNVLPGWEADNGFTLRGAKQMPTGLESKFFQLQNGVDTYVIEGNVVKDLDILENAAGQFYSGSGEIIENDTFWNTKTSYKKGDWILEGTAVAFETSLGGKKALVMDAVDEDGNIDQQRNAGLYPNDGSDKAQGKPIVVNMLRRKDAWGYDEVVYQKVDVEEQVKQSIFGSILGKEINDMSGILKEETEKGTDIKGMISEEEIKQQAVPKLPEYHQAFEEPLFLEQMKYFSQDGSLRSSLGKAFYLTYADLRGENYDLNTGLKGNDFQSMIEMLELQKYAKSPHYTDSQLIQMFNQTMKSKAQNQQEVNNVELITQKMSNYLDLIKGPKNNSKK